MAMAEKVEQDLGQNLEGHDIALQNLLSAFKRCSETVKNMASALQEQDRAHARRINVGVGSDNLMHAALRSTRDRAHQSRTVTHEGLFKTLATVNVGMDDRASLVQVLVEAENTGKKYAKVGLQELDAKDALEDAIVQERLCWELFQFHNKSFHEMMDPQAPAKQCIRAIGNEALDQAVNLRFASFNAIPKGIVSKENARSAPDYQGTCPIFCDATCDVTIHYHATVHTQLGTCAPLV